MVYIQNNAKKGRSITADVQEGKMAFYFFDCKSSDRWAYIYSVSAKETALECCDSDRIEFIPPLDYVLEGKNLGAL